MRLVSEFGVSPVSPELEPLGVVLGKDKDTGLVALREPSLLMTTSELSMRSML